MRMKPNEALDTAPTSATTSDTRGTCGSAVHGHRHSAVRAGHGAAGEEPRVQRIGALQGARQAGALGVHLPW